MRLLLFELIKLTREVAGLDVMVKICLWVYDEGLTRETHSCLKDVLSTRETCYSNHATHVTERFRYGSVQLVMPKMAPAAEVYSGIGTVTQVKPFKLFKTLDY